MGLESRVKPYVSSPAPSAVVPLEMPPKRRFAWRRRAVIALLVAVGIAGLLALAQRAPIPVATVTVTRGTVVDEVSSSDAGEVKVTTRAVVSAETSARVIALRHRRGERVARGDVVVELDASESETRLNQAAATVQVRRAQAAQAKAQAAVAQLSEARERRLATIGASTAKALEEADASAREAEASWQAAIAQLEEASAALDVAKLTRTRAAIRAPFAGVVAEVYVDVGDQAAVGTSVIELIDDSRMYVEATLDEADLGRVALGQPATLRLDALPATPLTGQVAKLDPTVRRDDKGARTLRVEIELTPSVASMVRPGMSANVDIRVAEKRDVLYLPTSAIIGRGVRRTVLVVDGGVARERVITTGQSSWERIEVTGGLNENDQVIATLNIKGLASGSRVTTEPVTRP